MTTARGRFVKILRTDAMLGTGAGTNDPRHNVDAFRSAGGDRNGLGLLYRRRGFRQGDRQHAFLEGRRHLVLVHRMADRDAAFETAIEALAELTLLVFRLALLFAAQDQDAVLDLDFDI